MDERKKTIEVQATTPDQDKKLDCLREGLRVWLEGAAAEGIEHELALTALMLFCASGCASKTDMTLEKRVQEVAMDIIRARNQLVEEQNAPKYGVWVTPVQVDDNCREMWAEMTLNDGMMWARAEFETQAEAEEFAALGRKHSRPGWRFEPRLLEEKS